MLRGAGAPGAALPRDRTTLAAGAALLAVVVAAWAGVLSQARTMPMHGGDMPPMEGMHEAGVGGLPGLAAFLAAWTVMMVAMMLPSAAPLVLLYRVANPTARTSSSLALAAGYLLTWALVGVPAYVAQEAIGAAAHASMGVAAVLPYGVAAVLVAAGVYQLTPLKDVCLRQCRSPLDFLVQRWRPGRLGALRLGMEHGAYCVGCCWGLMAVLVAAGAMSLAWVAIVALVVFVEKLLPAGHRAARATGGVLVGLGALVALRPELALLLRGGGMAG